MSFDTRIYEVQLDDHHQEYGDFPNWAAALNASWDRYAASTEEDMKAGRSGTNFTGENLWAKLPRLEVKFYDSEGDREEGDHDAVDSWTIRGTLVGLRHLYQELLAQLATPAWHWYGMGGDDHAYDYWPNAMLMAVQLRDQLLEIARAEADYKKENWDYEHNTTYISEDLDRVYWLVRTRWEADLRRSMTNVTRQEIETGFDDFLSADEFGPREILGL